MPWLVEVIVAGCVFVVLTRVAEAFRQRLRQSEASIDTLEQHGASV